MEETLTWLENTGPAVTIAESAWIFPTAETLHVLGLALLVGSIAAFDLRVLGLAGRARPTATLVRTILPWTWTGFALAVVTGLVMFMSDASHYASSPVFLAKLGLLVLAGGNALLFHVHPHGRQFFLLDRATPLLKASAVLSLTVWTSLVVAGRWIGFA